MKRGSFRTFRQRTLVYRIPPRSTDEQFTEVTLRWRDADPQYLHFDGKNGTSIVAMSDVPEIIEALTTIHREAHDALAIPPTNQE